MRKNLILQKLQYLQLQKEMLPIELLGRSLSYNNFVPRLAGVCAKDLCEYFGSDFVESILIYNDEINSLLHKLDSIESVAKCVFVREYMESRLSMTSEITESSTQGNLKIDSIESVYPPHKSYNDEGNILDSISAIRRFSSSIIVYDSILIDCYQLLEICIAGADMFVLDIATLLEFSAILTQIDSIESKNKDSMQIANLDSKEILQNMILKILHFASNLGLIPIFKNTHLLESNSDFITCIYAKKNKNPAFKIRMAK